MLQRLNTAHRIWSVYGRQQALPTLIDLWRDEDLIRLRRDGGEFRLYRDPSLAGTINHLVESTPKLENLANVVEPEDRVIFDVGAHSGLFSAFVKHRNPDARVFAYEPDRDLHPAIQANLEPYDDWELIGKAISDEPGEVTFHVGDYKQTSSLLEEAVAVWGPSRPVTVPATTIDAEAGRLGLERIDVLKLDIQGAEPRAIAGASRTLGTVRKLLIEMSFLDERPELLLAQLRAEFGDPEVVNHVQSGADLLFRR